MAVFLFVQLAYLYNFQLKVTIQYSLKYTKSCSIYLLMNFLLFCEIFLFCFRGVETVFDLWSWSLSYGKLFEEGIYSKLLSIVFLRKVISFKKTLTFLYRLIVQI